jgi:hypothetical protein
LKIVQNQILVDIQGKDVLYQIFTANVLQQGMKCSIMIIESVTRVNFENIKIGVRLTRIEAEDEAPFLEYIQRVCGLDELSHFRPGCGGFGIRNFLTLFLSIEV